MDGKHYKLSILPLFEDDLAEIVDYITFHLRNSTAAENLIDAVEKAIEERLDRTEAFEPYYSDRERKHPCCRIRVRNFAIFYVAIGSTTEVRWFIYSNRNFKDLI